MVQKNTYYINFGLEQFFGAKEILRSMPMFYNTVYFSSRYGNAMYHGEHDEEFHDITLLAKTKDIDKLRQIIKNNFLYINDWDSVKFTDNEDYGFSFIGGNIKFVVMVFDETQDGYHIKGYEPDAGLCTDTDIEANKQYFLDVSMNEQGEFVRIADFNTDQMNDQNTQKKLAPKKNTPQMAVYESRGYATINLIIIPFIILLSVSFVFLARYLIN